VRVSKCLRDLRVAGAALITLCLALCCMSCSPAAGRLSSLGGVAPAGPGAQLWARTVPRGAGSGEAVSPDGTTLFVAGVLKGHFETIAYRAATGARVWARGYKPAGSTCACFPPYIAVSPDGARVYVTGRTLSGSGLGEGAAILAYDARTGRQLWVRRYLPQSAYGGLAVSPEGTTLYTLGARRVSDGKWRAAVIAYAAATGRRRWLRSYSRHPGFFTSLAVSPDGKMVYATGSANATGSAGPSSVLAVAYGAAGNLKWTARYNNPYPGGASGAQIVVAPSGTAVYVVGAAANKYGHIDTATFAYRAATGKQLWLDRYNSYHGGGQVAVTPDSRTVIVAGQVGNGRGYVLASYNASTGATRWTRRAVANSPAELAIDPHGDTVFVATAQYLGGSDIAAWSVADGTVLWTTRYNGAKIWDPVAIALSSDGTRLFETGSGRNGGMITVAYKA
jgi:DNA-binding beta-propeller fold protein YncE